MTQEILHARETAHAAALTETTEFITRRVVWTLKKYHDKSDLSEIDADTVPDEIIIVEGNVALNDGINFLLNRLIGGADGTYPPWSNANAKMEVGNSAAAAVASQTDLQGGSQTEKAMDATYPQVVAQTVSFKSSFTSGEANHAWEEVGVKNGAGAISSTVKMLNRKVQAFGTKVTGTWTMQLDITLA